MERPNDRHGFGGSMLSRFHMKPVRRRIPIWVPSSIVAVLVLSACGNITNPFADEGRLESIRISGDTMVAVGDTIRLSTWGNVGGVLGFLLYDRVLDAVWSASDPKIASIVPVKPIAGDTISGSAVILTGLRPGSVQVTAAARGVTGKTTVRVISPP